MPGPDRVAALRVAHTPSVHSACPPLQHTFMFEWNRGDVMLVDNLKWAHARSNLAPGGDRMLFASYANMYRAGDIETRPPSGAYGMKEQGAALHDPPIPVAAAP